MARDRDRRAWFQGVIERLDIDADHFYSALNNPLRRFLIKSGRVGIIVVIITQKFVCPRIDHQDVAPVYTRRRIFEVLRRYDAPFPFGDRHRDSGAEEPPRRVVGKRAAVFRPWIGASICVERCMMVATCCTKTPPLA